MNSIAPYAKAIVGAAVAGLGAAGTALTDGVVSGQEWVAIASATLVALGVVFGVPNKDPEAEHQDESVQPAVDDTDVVALEAEYRRIARILGKA